jgi:hypothetical protein
VFTHWWGPPCYPDQGPELLLPDGTGRFERKRTITIEALALLRGEVLANLAIFLLLHRVLLAL